MKKRLISLVLALALICSAAPALHVYSADADMIGTGQLVLDTDPSGGYEGDYVLIYNPSTSAYTEYTTGNMSGLIETEVDPYSKQAKAQSDNNELLIIDVDSLIAAADMERAEAEPPAAEKTSYNVGDTHTFYISSYSPGPSQLSFICLAKGDHCYIWTPSQNLDNYYPLNAIDPSFAQIVADEFDLKYPEMNSSFGDHNNGSNGDGRINLMYYNIDDGFEPGVSEGYVAGYFSSYDYSSNGYPMIHIDTYPGVYYVNEEGEESLRLERTYGVFCHEYQHLINYSQTGGMDTWLNECMSAAAEEICYPGSSVVPRIQSWERYYFNDNDDWLDPPHEFEYFPDYELHNGYSMYNWSNYLDYVLPLYSQVSFFSQYLFTQFDNTIFKTITQNYAQSNNAVSAIQTAIGGNVSDFVKNFRIALVANDRMAFNGQYGFDVQAAYDPEEYHGVENPYSLLGPVVFTGSSCSIAGGGAIVVKPVGGVYNPPAGASSQLVYVGISRNIEVEPVSLEGMEITPEEALGYVGSSVKLRVVRTPFNANDYDVEWTCSDENVASVRGGNYSATVTGLSEGSVTVTCTASDRASGNVYTDSAEIVFEAYPTLDEALNVGRGTIAFSTDSSLPWIIDLDHEGRVCATSSNVNISNSSSNITATVQMRAGETLSFDWAVSSENNYDKLKFIVNNSETAAISGNHGFAHYSYTAPSAGTYTFMWSYVKDYSVDNGSDRGWLDNVEYSGDPGNLVIPGDVDQNGSVEVYDALITLRYAMSIGELDETQLLAADVDGSGTVDIADALIILRMSMGIQ